MSIQAGDKNEIFECFKYVLPYLDDLLVGDVGVSLTDREKYLLYKPGNRLDLKIPPGTPVKQGSSVWRAMLEKRRIVMKVDKALFGQPCIAVAVPLYNSANEVIGAVSAQETVERQEELQAVATRLTESIEVLASTSEELSAQAEEIAAASQETASSVRSSQIHIGETEKVLGLIRTVANQTNLLGLNAAIEAARVGDAGRGFSVVASEIRKLAEESAKSIKNTEGIIRLIQKDSIDVSAQVQHTSSTITQVSEAIYHMASAIQVANGLARRLDDIANSLSNED